MTKVVHLIPGLDKAGAETVLYKLLQFHSNEAISYRVISLGHGDYYNSLIKELGYELNIYDIKAHPLRSLLNIIKELRQVDVVCCWMYHACFLGYCLGKIAKCKKIVWSIHHSNLNPKYDKRSTLIIAKICAFISPKVYKILYSGQTARVNHEKVGYAADKSDVVINGCDTTVYHPISGAREKLFGELGIENDKKIILSVSRFHPIKDIGLFVQTLGELVRQRKDIVGVMCGRNINRDNVELINMIENAGVVLNNNVFLLDVRTDIEVLMSACDVYVLHSVSEAFPGTLLEAMACGTLAVTTNAGEAMNMMPDKSCVVPVKDKEALSKKIFSLLDISAITRDKLILRNIDYVHKKYSVEETVKHYECIFEE